MMTWLWRLAAVFAFITMGAGVLQLMVWGGSIAGYAGQVAGLAIGVAGCLGTLLYAEEKHRAASRAAA